METMNTSVPIVIKLRWPKCHIKEFTKPKSVRCSLVHILKNFAVSDLYLLCAICICCERFVFAVTVTGHHIK